MSLDRFAHKPLVTAHRDDSVAVVAHEMLAHHVGAVAIVDGRRPVGIVTDRDLTLRVLAGGLPPSTPVREVMSGDLVTMRVEHDVDSALLHMRHKGVRRLLLVDAGGGLVGIVTLDDLQVMLSGELSATAELVRDNRGP